jgi:hypothetical protein
VDRSKTQTFAGIQSQVQRKLVRWKEKLLSQAGKEILIKAVIQAIPTYSMSVFQVPKHLCKKLNSLMGRFWWSHQKEGKGVSWMSGEKLSLSKQLGGLAFQDLEAFHLALLSKQGWRLVHYPISLVACIFKEKYFPASDFLNAQLDNRPSFAWRSIFQAKAVLDAGLVCRVGNGENIRIWGDRWLSSASLNCIRSSVRELGLEFDSFYL